MKDFFSNKYVLLSFYSLLAVAGTIVAVKTYVKRLTIFPNVITHVGWESDHTFSKGNTVTHYFHHNENNVQIGFTKKEGDNGQYPFFVLYFISSTTRYLDLSQYEYVQVELEAEVDSSPLPIPVRIQTFIPDYTVTTDTESFGITEQMILYEDGVKKYKLPLDQFVIPAWWWQVNPGFTKDGSGEFSYSRVTEIHICDSPGLLEKKQHFSVYSISLVKNNSIAMASALFTVIAFLGAGFQLQKVVNIKSVSEFHTKKFKRSTVMDEDTSKLINYIAEHYTDPEISAETVQKATGFSENKVSSLLKSYSNTSFKKYLNKVRLQEACRLLTETDRQINEIAYKVGYTSIPHFNRVFKEFKGCSPNQYRKNFTKRA